VSARAGWRVTAAGLAVGLLAACGGGAPSPDEVETGGLAVAAEAVTLPAQHPISRVAWAGPDALIYSTPGGRVYRAQLDGAERPHLLGFGGGGGPSLAADGEGQVLAALGLIGLDQHGSVWTAEGRLLREGWWGIGDAGAIAVTDAGDRIAVAGFRVEVYGIVTGLLLAEAERSDDQASYQAVTFDSAGERLVAVPGPGLVDIWDVTGTEATLERTDCGCDGTTMHALAPDGAHVAFGTFAGGLALWDVAAGTVAADRTVVESPAELVKPHAVVDGRYVLYTAADAEAPAGELRVWDTESGEVANVWTAPGGGNILDVRPQPRSGRLLIVVAASVVDDAPALWVGELER
jgi:hypothetical protein